MPELSFSSNPPLDQADILSLIVFNQPINELGEGQQVVAGAARRGAGRRLPDVRPGAVDRQRARARRVRDPGGRARTAAGPSLTVGEQVGEKLFVRVRQGFGDAQATEFILEYQLADYLRLQATVAEIAGGTQRVAFRRVERGGLDLIFFFSY